MLLGPIVHQASVVLGLSTMAIPFKPMSLCGWLRMDIRIHRHEGGRG